MLKRRNLITAGLVVALVASAVGVSLAQSDGTTTTNPLPQAVCRPLHERGENLNHLTDALGMSVVEIRDYLANGGTIESLAAEKGVDLAALHEQLQAEHLAELETCLNDAVASGTITQAQADWVLQSAQLAMQRPELLESCRPLVAHIDFQAIFAEAAGMTVDELRAYLADGGNLRELAAEKGIDLDALQEQAHATVAAELETCLSEGVAAGTITQAQADFLLEQMHNGNLRGMRGEHGMPGMPGMNGEHGMPGMRGEHGMPGMPGMPGGRGGRGNNG
jgi:DNA-binding transcriptional MerR regulator